MDGGGGGFTCSVTGGDALPRNFPVSALVYAADTVCDPSPSAVVKVAFPDASSGTGVGPGEPSTVKTTEPVGTTVPGAAVTAAVNVTGWPTTAGFGDPATAVVVGAGLTVCATEALLVA